MISSWLAQLKAEENTEAESKQSWLEKLGTNSKVKEEEEGWRGDGGAGTLCCHEDERSGLL